MSYTEATGVAETSRKRARTDEFGGPGGAPAHEGGVLGGGFQQETGDGDEDDGDEDGRDKTGRRKIKIEFINDKSRRHITFSKRKAGIMKKAYELSTLTGTQVLLLVVSETGLVYTFTTSKLQPLVTQPEGKNLIQACLNAPTNPPQPSYMQPPPPHPAQMQMPPPQQQHAHVHAPPYPQQPMPPHIQQQLHDEDERSVSPHSQHATSANGANAPPPAPTQRGSRPRRAAATNTSYREESPSEDAAGANGNNSSGRSDPPSQSYGNGYGGAENPISQGYSGMQGFPPAPSSDWNYGRRG